MDVFPPNFAQL